MSSVAVSHEVVQIRAGQTATVRARLADDAAQEAGETAWLQEDISAITCRVLDVNEEEVATPAVTISAAISDTLLDWDKDNVGFNFVHRTAEYATAGRYWVVYEVTHVLGYVTHVITEVIVRSIPGS